MKTQEEMEKALQEAVPGKAPGVRDAINDHLMHLAKAPTHEEIIQVNRGAHHKE